MDRETRKANLKKLQLPSILKSNSTTNSHSSNSGSVSVSNCNLRRTRSATTVISNYFKHTNEEKVTQFHSQTANNNETSANRSRHSNECNVVNATVEETDGNIAQEKAPTTSKRAKRTKLTAFILKDGKNIPGATKDDFETPQKTVKKAPKLQRKKAGSKKTKKSNVNKYQPKIESAFLHNEQMFAEIAAQHCRAENFNADEVQLALALSKSEAEISGVLCVESEEETATDLMNVNEATTKECSNTENIRNMLQRYGFRTAANEDYNKLSVAFLPGVKRRTKCKWANKFTPLTLRSSEIQFKKVIEKIDKIMEEQDCTKPLTAAESYMENYKLVSDLLRNCQAKQRIDACRLRGLDAESNIVLEEYYVKDLFEVACVQAGHLLRDWHAIPGRDFSPVKSECNVSELKMRKSYADLEEHFGMQVNDCPRNDPAVKASARGCELDKLLQLIEQLPDNHNGNMEMQSHAVKLQTTIKMSTDEISKTAETPIKEPLIKKLKLVNGGSDDNFQSDIVLSKLEQLSSINNIISSKALSTTSSLELQSSINQPLTAIDINNDNSSTALVEISKSVNDNSRIPLIDLALKCSNKPLPKLKDKCKKDANVFTEMQQKSELLGNCEQLVICEHLNTAHSSSSRQNARVKSPDLFAESDSEIEVIAEEMHKKETLQKSDNDDDLSLNKQDITIYELYSSSEVKTSSDNVNCELSFEKHKEQKTDNNVNVLVNVVDLTQDENENEIIDAKQKHTMTQNLSENLKNNFTLNALQDKNDRDFHMGDAESEICNEPVSSPLSSTVDDEAYQRLCEKYLTPREKLNLQRKSVSMTQLNVCNNQKSPTELNANIQKGSLTQATPNNDFVWKTPTKVLKSASPFKRTQSATLKHPINYLNSLSQNSDVEGNIDLTQSDISNSDYEENCIMLSDDEINYSIWKAKRNKDAYYINKSDNLSSSNSLQSEIIPSKNDFSILDILSDSQTDTSTEASESIRMRTVSSMSSSSIENNSASLSSKHQLEVNNFSICSELLGSPKMNERLRERAEFGILDNVSEPFTQSPKIQRNSSNNTANGNSCIHDLNNFSLLDSPSENANFMKRYSSEPVSTHKFNKLLQNMQKSEKTTALDAFEDFDEFDQLIYGAEDIKKCSITPSKQNIPAGLEKLLNAELSFCSTQNDVGIEVKTMQTTPTKYASDTSMECEIAGRKYTARVVTNPKPDYMQQSEAELLKQLYAYGLKPLKRKQAVKILEYIYNQTHPIILDEQQLDIQALATSINLEKVQRAATASPPLPPPATAVAKTIAAAPAKKTATALVPAKTTAAARPAVRVRGVTAKSSLKQQTEKTQNSTGNLSNNLQLSDCSGNLLLRFRFELQFEIENESYVYQTNISKKLQQPLLPLHVAWYNLVCSNTKLHEKILMYEPIDLQEIHQFFKHLGYFFNPKDMKSFFDSRCIIFRYDLTLSGKPTKHFKHKKKPSKRKTSSRNTNTTKKRRKYKAN